jgi:hypothetical protein
MARVMIVLRINIQNLVANVERKLAIVILQKWYDEKKQC